MDGLRQFVTFRSFVFSLWTPSKRQSSTISANARLRDGRRGDNMKPNVWFTVAAVCLSLLAAAREVKTQSSGSGTTDRPEFTGTKNLIRPENYRAWVFLS